MADVQAIKPFLATLFHTGIGDLQPFRESEHLSTDECALDNNFS